MDVTIDEVTIIIQSAIFALISKTKLYNCLNVGICFNTSLSNALIQMKLFIDTIKQSKQHDIYHNIHRKHVSNGSRGDNDETSLRIVLRFLEKQKL